MSSLSVVNRTEPGTELSELWFNVSLEPHDEAVFNYVNDQDEVTSWRPYPELPKGIRDRLVEAVSRLPRAWLMPLKDGEVFNTYQASQARVFSYSLAAGFMSVSGQGLTAIRKNIRCIYYGKRPRNDGDLSSRVEKDPKT
jgi:hypothetical protein